jgi:hypothetical protein
MNAEAADNVMHYTLLDTLQMAGWSGRPLAVATLGLIVLGVVLLVKRPSPSSRWGYTMASALPLLIGLTGTVTGMMSAFSTLGSRALADGIRFFAAMGEVTLPLSIGLFGSAIAMTFAFFVWIRGVKPVKL